MCFFDFFLLFHLPLFFRFCLNQGFWPYHMKDSFNPSQRKNPLLPGERISAGFIVEATSIDWMSMKISREMAKERRELR